MSSKEERDRRLRRIKRNEAARSLKNFKPKVIENKKKSTRYEDEKDWKKWFNTDHDV